MEPSLDSGMGSKYTRANRTMTVATLQKLENAGFDRKQAQSLVESFATDLDQLATKADVLAVKSDLYRALWLQLGAFIAITAGLLASMRGSG